MSTLSGYLTPGFAGAPPCAMAEPSSSVVGVLRSINAGDHGEHGGTLLVVREAAVGEPCWFRAVPSRRALFRLTVMRARLTVGSRLSVTML